MVSLVPELQAGKMQLPLVTSSLSCQKWLDTSSMNTTMQFWRSWKKKASRSSQNTTYRFFRWCLWTVLKVSAQVGRPRSLSTTQETSSKICERWWMASNQSRWTHGTRASKAQLNGSPTTGVSVWQVLLHDCQRLNSKSLSCRLALGLATTKRSLRRWRRKMISSLTFRSITKKTECILCWKCQNSVVWVIQHSWKHSSCRRQSALATWCCSRGMERFADTRLKLTFWKSSLSIVKSCMEWGKSTCLANCSKNMRSSSTKSSSSRQSSQAPSRSTTKSASKSWPSAKTSVSKAGLNSSKLWASSSKVKQPNLVLPRTTKLKMKTKVKTMRSKKKSKKKKVSPPPTTTIY